MNQNKPTLAPLFDCLQAMLKGEDYQPKPSKIFQQDYEHAKDFLLNYRDSIDTFNSYRRYLKMLSKT
jgi:hypothetical protein